MGSTQGLFLPSLLQMGRAISEKKIFLMIFCLNTTHFRNQQKRKLDEENPEFML
jgi:hypothetical protein